MIFREPFRLIACLMVAALILVIFFFSGIFPVKEWFHAGTQGLTASVAASDVASLTNEQRIENGLPPLSVSPLLSEAAQLKAQDMAQYSYYAHTGPDGKTPLSWLSQVGYRYLNAGENLVIDRTSASDAVSAWMGSPEHRENILRPQFTEIGVGVAEGQYDGIGTIFVVEEFGTPYPTYTSPHLKSNAAAPVTQTKTVVAAAPAPAVQQVPTVAVVPPVTASLPKVATLDELAPVHPKKEVTVAAAPKPTMPKGGVSAVVAPASSATSAPKSAVATTSAVVTATSTVSFALAPEFFKPVTIPKNAVPAEPATPEGASATRLSVWIAGIKAYFRNFLRF